MEPEDCCGDQSRMERPGVKASRRRRAIRGTRRVSA